MLMIRRLHSILFVNHYVPFVEYLHHTKFEIDGVKFYGHPYTPIFCNMAFNANEEELEKTFFQLTK